jgi:UDP-glucose 4-epimerase
VGDIRDQDALTKASQLKPIDAVIHFAGLKAVGESVRHPIDYFDNNVTGTLQLLKMMDRVKARTLVFSSSATVYGDPDSVPIVEDAPVRPTNPYGRSKLVIEGLLTDLMASSNWRIALLRYFNPAGAHESGLIGEDPRGIPNNLMPYVGQVASGLRDHLNIFGSDYATRDGTGVRDYIHVVDLAAAHVAALRYLNDHGGLITANVGTGRGYSVLEVVQAYERACGKKIPYKIVDRRPGDVAEVWASCDRAKALLQWQAQYELEKICEDGWRWQRYNDQRNSSN